MPFHHRLLGRDRYAMFSFIHSFNTTFGVSVWEPVAEILARWAKRESARHIKLRGQIDPATAQAIEKIYYDLRKGTRKADKPKEIAEIKKLIQAGREELDPDSEIDFFVKVDDEENYFDITSAKPNMKEFAALKLKLLRWVALRLSVKKGVTVNSRLAIPYNPYHPEPYERWTLSGLYDLKNQEVLVGKDFWNFVAGGDIFESLLDVFQEVGKSMRKEIDEGFARFR